MNENKKSSFDSIDSDSDFDSNDSNDLDSDIDIDLDKNDIYDIKTDNNQFISEYDMTWYTCDEDVMNYLNQLHCMWTCTVSPKSPVVHAIGILVGQRIRASLAKQYRQLIYQALLHDLKRDELISVSSSEMMEFWKQNQKSINIPQHLQIKIQEFLFVFSKMEQKYSLNDGLSWLEMWKNQAFKYSRMPTLPYFGSWSYHAWLLMMMIQYQQGHQHWLVKSLWLTDYTLKHVIFPALNKTQMKIHQWLKQKEQCWGQYANQITFVLWRSSLT